MRTRAAFTSLRFTTLSKFATHKLHILFHFCDHSAPPVGCACSSTIAREFKAYGLLAEHTAQQRGIGVLRWLLAAVRR
jgi:hypothetical protein